MLPLLAPLAALAGGPAERGRARGGRGLGELEPGSFWEEQIQTDDGRIDVDLGGADVIEDERDRYEARLGDGQGRIDIRAGDGRVRVRDR